MPGEMGGKGSTRYSNKDGKDCADGLEKFDASLSLGMLTICALPSMSSTG